MNEAVSVRDVMNRDYVGVSEGDTVAGAAALLRDEGVEGAVVLRGSEPVGMLTAADVVAMVADGRDPEGTAVGDVMRDRAGWISPDSSLSEAVGELADSDVGWLLVREEGDVVGVVSEHDVVTAHSVLPAVEEGHEGAIEEPATAEGAGGRARTRERDELTAQGVCEVCGALAHDLSQRNGQLVCPDCREIGS